MAERVDDGRGSSEALNFLGLGATVRPLAILESVSMGASAFAIAGAVALMAATAIFEK